MVSLNRVQLHGALGADPEIKSTRDGKSFANLRIATSEEWKDQRTGEKKERTDWHNVVVWGDGLCQLVETHLRKGSRLYVEGKLQTRSWEDQKGEKRYSTEVVVQGFDGKLIFDARRDRDGGGSRRDDDRGESRGRDDREGRSGGGSYARSGRGSDIDDEIPFAPCM